MTTINIRVEESVKQQASKLFDELGLDMTTAMNLFLRQSIQYGGIPFEIRRLNTDTLLAIEEVEKIKRGELKAKRYNNIDELFADLEREGDDEV